MAKMKITVVKKIFHEDLAAEYCGKETSICTSFEEGQEFVFEGLGQPENFCGFAWNDLHKVVLALSSGGGFSPFMKEDNTLISCCTDGIRPVVFKVERPHIGSPR